jgi:hypothetical protein
MAGNSEGETWGFSEKLSSALHRKFKFSVTPAEEELTFYRPKR